MTKPAAVRQTAVYMRLEPYDGKLSRTVLRREGRSNPPDLADFYGMRCKDLKLMCKITEVNDLEKIA